MSRFYKVVYMRFEIWRASLAHVIPDVSGVYNAALLSILPKTSSLLKTNSLSETCVNYLTAFQSRKSADVKINFQPMRVINA